MKTHMKLVKSLIRGFAPRFTGLAMLVFSAAAVADFVVEDIRVDGAQNIEVGTIFNYLPIKVGDVADEALINQSIKALFATGFFQDVQIRRQEAILIVAVSERPAISDVEFTGNKDIDDESIEKALAQVGVTQGRIFREPLLEQLVQAIVDQYCARG